MATQWIGARNLAAVLEPQVRHLGRNSIDHGAPKDHPSGLLKIMEGEDSIDFLTLLREGWTECYQFQLEVLGKGIGSGQECQDEIATAVQVAVDYLRKFQVSCCRGNNSVPLEETALALPHLE